MKVRDVYETALAFLAEKGGSCVEYDFEERAPFIIAAAAAEAETLDREYRRTYGIPDTRVNGGADGAGNQGNSGNDNDGRMASGSTLMLSSSITGSNLSIVSNFGASYTGSSCTGSSCILSYGVTVWLLRSSYIGGW